MKRNIVVFAAAVVAGSLAACTQMGGVGGSNTAGGMATESPSKDLSLTIYSTADVATFDPRLLLASAASVDPYGMGHYQGQYPGYQDLVPGFAVVRDTRSVDLHAGVNHLIFRGIPADIDPTSMSFESLTDPGSVMLATMRFDDDLLDSDALLKAHIGQNVIVSVAGDSYNPAKSFAGTLLSVDDNNLVLRTTDAAHPIQTITRNENIKSIALADAGTSPITQPQLALTVNARKGGRQDVRITYHTLGTTWRADYVLTFTNEKDQQAGLRGWVSLLNQSRAGYTDASVELVAGDVRRFALQPPQVIAGSVGAGTIPAYFRENPPYEGHIYPMEKRISLPDQSLTQVALFEPRMGISASKGYAYDHSADTTMRYSFGPWSAPNFPSGGAGGNMGFFNQSQAFANREAPASYWIGSYNLLVNHNVDVVVKISNTAANHLGIALPAGRVREYQQQASGQDQFIGEDVIDHVDTGGTLSIRAGVAPDITAHADLLDSQWNDNGTPRKLVYKIVLHNQKTQAVRVDVREHLYPGPKWWISDKTDDYETLNASTIAFPVDVPATSDRTVYYTVNYDYAGP